MRIGFDAKRLFCNGTGLGNYSRTLVHNLMLYQPQHDYRLYTPYIKQLPQAAPFLQNNAAQIFQPHTAFKGIWRSWGLPKQLQKDQIDIYHGLSHELPIGIAQAGLKSIVTIHDLIFKVYPNTYSWFDRKIYNWKFKYSCTHANKIIAISEHTKQDIIKYYQIPAHKIEVIYQACQSLFYEASHPSKDVLAAYSIPKQYILSVGTVQERKNIKLLFQAYQYLDPKFQLPVVIVGGGGSYKKALKKFIAQQQLDNRVIWIEHLSNNLELKTLYQAANLVVYPSFYEGFGLPVVEALLSKTPVITSKTSALTEAGGPHSLYIDPYQPQALAQAIQQVLSQPQLAALMRQKGYEYAHQMFHPQQLSQQLMHCYQRVLTKN